MKPRILIVDDQPELTRMLRLLLESTGAYEVREITRPLQVSEACRIFQPDLLILDMDMPGKNGAEIARELLRDGHASNASIIFLSGLVSNQEAGLRPTPNGNIRFLSKAADASQTLQAVREVIAELKAAA